MRCLLALLLLLTSSLAAAKDSADVELARAAFRYGFPVYQMMFTRSQQSARLPAGFNATNTLFHRVSLADHNSRDVTTPNNDTLYSSAWLDLSNGPVLLTMPPLADRYHSVALMSLFTDNFAVLGTRTNGGAGGRVLIVGPAWTGPPPTGATLVRAPTDDVWMLIRILAGSGADLQAARAAQSRFQLISAAAPPRRPLAAPTSSATDPQIFLAAVNEALARGPLPPLQAHRAVELRRAGIGAPWDSLSPAMQVTWRTNIARFYEELRGGLGSVGTVVNGWTYPRPGLGDFGADDFYRAKVALGGLAALPLQEAIYVSAAKDGGGAPLDGRYSYRLHLPATIPVTAFWSLSMYEVAADGRLFFTDNRIARYAIGDRTEKLKRNADGSLDVLIGNTPPADVANWLPAPAGPFRLTFRGYLPQPGFLSGHFRLNGIEKVNAPLPGGVSSGASTP